ncbi:hypothetical protein LA080_003965 [Diaporthe eres]|nr:hypothetical protein LA080_003965 [Diaporthe eres]
MICSQDSMSHPPLPLPRVPGPKLGPFTPDAHAEIKFIEALDSSDDLDSEVWKIEINGRVYALKMFDFCGPRYLKNVLARELAQPLSSSQAYEDYYDPFNCECRAYGRLAQENRLDLAVPAHGYLLLTPQQEREVTPMITGDLEYEPDDEEPLGTLNGEKTWGRWEEHRGQPIRGIVKELVEDDDFEEAFKTGRVSASTMWRDLEDLHALGILGRDIHMGNYMGGRLVDLSRAWTMYHPGLDQIRPRDLARLRRLDTHGLLVMLQDWWMETLVVDELDIPESLQGCDAGENDHGTDPRRYNWLRWEEDGEAAAEYVQLNLFVRDI